MIPCRRLLLVPALGAALAVTCAHAAVPSAAYSTIPARLLASPDGAFVSQVTVHDVANNPIAGSGVRFRFAACTQFHPCPTPCADCYVGVSDRTIYHFTGITGLSSVALRMGGSSCPNPPLVEISADGVPLGTVPFASLDQDGDLSVTPADVATVQSLIGSGDLRADFDGDGLVSAADLGIVQAHLGATCDTSTPVRRHSWGRLKTIYR